MKVVIKKAGQKPEIKEIKDELHAMQEIVGGYIECFEIGIDNIVCVCNEEGKLKKLRPNFVYNGDLIVGDVFFCSAGEDDFESLTDGQAEFVADIIRIFEV